MPSDCIEEELCERRPQVATFEESTARAATRDLLVAELRPPVDAQIDVGHGGRRGTEPAIGAHLEANLAAVEVLEVDSAVRRDERQPSVQSGQGEGNLVQLLILHA